MKNKIDIRIAAINVRALSGFSCDPFRIKRKFLAEMLKIGFTEKDFHLALNDRFPVGSEK